jgi:dipeptidyl aminopeptidase/acylaminoacyl peptidase
MMTPELLWNLGRVSAMGMSNDNKNIIYSVSTPNIQDNKSKRVYYSIPVHGGQAVEISSPDSLITNSKISPNGKYIIYDKEVKINKIKGSDYYPELTKSNAYIYNDLDHRHWDTWNDGTYSHVFIAELVNGVKQNEKDLMANEPYYCPQRPFGGDEDYIWSPDSKNVIYVTKKKAGREYTLSTNTDIYQYNVETGRTTNLTQGMMGYDLNPSFDRESALAWLSMKRDGYESDKQDIIILHHGKKENLTVRWDNTVSGFIWSKFGRDIYFWAAVKGGAEQIFKLKCVYGCAGLNGIRQLTKGDFQISGVIGETETELIVTRVDFNHATEIYAVDKESGKMRQITHVNDVIYNTIGEVKAEMRSVRTSDNQQMPTWVVYPPNFDANKKYPTLLFCLGGPQGTTPFYSLRWNLQLMASQGYIVVCPDRRGVYGDGVKWTEGVSKDWGGLVMKDYLAAIDDVSKEKYVDKNRLGCVGASFGGFSVFMLEGLHNGRFKTFIAHDGVFDFRSEYGTTDEMWFENWEKAGPYWDKSNAAAQRSFAQSPSNFVEKWNTPIMIVQGGKDYRCPIEQGLQAFQAAQLKGIKSRLLYLPDQNHWVLTAQDAMVWQHEFFKWLDETLK